ncbi:copper chaperone PCu(A)C [Chthonobacter albigriseus]|uniref:copper chaperone PCu(A)C n=1 Tax=Chthonobacter albigriseus TaxID=1683161 RepID=UPI0015EF2D80|nr:copper chaperone PCu(A)C [Chthonobacter albigriseus]
MKTILSAAALLAALIIPPFAAPPALAQAMTEAEVEVPMVTVGDLEIAAPWARATPPGQKVSAVYFLIRNKSDKPISLIGASSPVAGSVVLHTMKAPNGFPQMTAIDAIEIPPKSEVEFQPGSYHLMLLGLNTMLSIGKAYDVTLKFSDGTEAALKAAVWDVGMVRVMKQ